MHTSCKDCKFAQFKHGSFTTEDGEQEGLIQVGCELGRLDKFGEAVQQTYDEDRAFSVLNGKLCNTYRPQTWIGDAAKARFQVRTKFAFLVYIGPDATPAKVAATASAIADLYLPAYQVFFLNNQDYFKARLINATVMAILGNKVTWRITEILARSDDGSRVSREEALDIGAALLPDPVGHDKPCATYCWFADAGDTFDADKTAVLDASLNDELADWRVLTGPDGQIVVCQIHLYKALGGYSPWVPEDGGPTLHNPLAKLATMEGSEGAIQGLETACVPL
jgi:hypothetical protein